MGSRCVLCVYVVCVLCVGRGGGGGGGGGFNKPGSVASSRWLIQNEGDRASAEWVLLRLRHGLRNHGLALSCPHVFRIAARGELQNIQAR
jgi:hypothetical protein